MARTVMTLNKNEPRTFGAFVWTFLEADLKNPGNQEAKFTVGGMYWVAKIGNEFLGVRVEKIEKNAVEVSY